MAAEDWITGAIVGGLIGVVMGILYAPKSGKETREDICKTAGEMYGKAKHHCEQMRIWKANPATQGNSDIPDESAEPCNVCL